MSPLSLVRTRYRMCLSSSSLLGTHRLARARDDGDVARCLLALVSVSSELAVEGRFYVKKTSLALTCSSAHVNETPFS